MKRMIRFLAIVLALVLGACPAVLAASSSTRMDENSSALKNNIDLAISAINGLTVYTDGYFSFNDMVGPRTAAEGYEKAINGRGVVVYGGGVSQVATTLYLALEERGDITYSEKRVYGDEFTGGYVYSGSDAIVTDYKNDIDFAFTNEGDSFTIDMWRTGMRVYCQLNDAEFEYDDDDDYDDSSSDWDDDDFIFSDSSWRKLTRSRILSIPEDMWGYARNEIYARHGYEFNTAKYRNYFNKKSWYEPGGFSTSDLNEIEWYNMNLIKDMEAEYDATSASHPSNNSGGSHSGDYIFPKSSSRKLTRSQILAIPEDEWGYARNEIYARHGYEFKTAKYRKYFSKKSWYTPGGFSTNDLNEIEWYNMNLIKEMEEEYGVD